MINVKALRPTSQQSQPTREDYAEPEQPKRRTLPLAILLFLTGCAAYLKSFMPVNVEAREAQERSKRTDDAEQARRDDEVGAVTEGAVTEEDLITAAAVPATKIPDKVVPIRIVLPQESDGFLLTGSLATAKAPPSSPRVAAGQIGDPVRVGDNRAPTRSISGDGGGGGGSGGGGGGGGGGEDNKQGRSRAPDTPLDPLRNRAPRTNGPVHLQDLVSNQVMMISMLALLAGATDADGNQLSVVGLSSSSGTITQAENGDWAFVCDEDTRGEVRLTYTITDGSASVQQTAYFSVEAQPIVGTAADDNLLGTHYADTIDGRGGDDNIDARGGNDTIFGGADDDHIVAGSGNDVVYAGAGNDVVFAGAGNDMVFGGSGDDQLFGEDGDDKILGEDGDDVISGGSGADILMAGAGNDTLQGDAGNDTLDGGDGNDNLAGGAGNDILSDGAGRDMVQGDAGHDHVVAAADADDDTYNGGAGRDTLDYSVTTQRVTVDLGNGTADGSEIGHDQITGFEEVVGGSGHDRIIAGSTAVSMTGGEGNDALDGGAGNDALDGGAGNDAISDGMGSDAVRGAGGDDHVVAAADAANDSYDGGAGQDCLDYSTATLSITVDLKSGTAEGVDIGQDLIAAFEEVIAGSGDDHIVAGSTSISMTGGDGNDTFEFQRAEGDQQTTTVRKITDFTVGDRIVAATFEIRYLQEDGLQEAISDMFADVYLSTDGDNRPVRFRFENVDNNELTLVDVHDRPDTEDFYTIELVGHHQLQFTVAIA